MPNIPLVDLKAQYRTIQGAIDAAIARVLANTSFIGGQEVKTFEENLAAFQRVDHAVGCNSGTAAIMLALLACGIGPGDEVITAANTFIATVEAIVHVGATPVLVDINPATYNLDPALLENVITPRTRAILPVHLFGQIAPMDHIMTIARQYGLLVIEDAAQAHAAEFQGHRAGHWGQAACMSFYPGKNLGAYGDAGAILTHNAELAHRLRKLRDHGSDRKYHHDEIGYNERMDALQAAILDVKLRHLEDWTEARRRHAARYSELLRDLPGVVTPVEMAEARHVYHIYCVRVPGNRDQIKAVLNERGIGAGIHYPVPVHLQPAFAAQGWRRGDFPHAEAAADTILSLPLYAELSEKQIGTVVKTLREVLENQRGAAPSQAGGAARR
jgi:dTDP-4-amino-4,6-dideoxygalactose transaminase